MWFSCLFILLHQEIQVTFTSTFAEKNIRKHEDCDNIIEGVTIHWELNGLSQDDPKLIEKIKTKVLWKPSTNSDVFGEQKSGSGRVRGLLFGVGSGSGITMSGSSPSGFGSPNTSLYTV